VANPNVLLVAVKAVAQLLDQAVLTVKSAMLALARQYLL
jgi:hypothetical protein